MSIERDGRLAFARLFRKLDLDCPQPPPEPVGGRRRCGQTGGYDHAHEAKAFEGDDRLPTVSITIRRCSRFIGSSGSNTIALIYTVGRRLTSILEAS